MGSNTRLALVLLPFLLFQQRVIDGNRFIRVEYPFPPRLDFAGEGTWVDPTSILQDAGNVAEGYENVGELPQPNPPHFPSAVMVLDGKLRIALLLFHKAPFVYGDYFHQSF